MNRYLCAVLVWGSFFRAVCADEQLPPAAQKAFERGMAAVQAEEFALAIKHFTEAQAEAPFYPAILFNLGLAHGKAGHEPIAIAWLHAYLTAAPDAANGTQVRAEIERLKEATRAKQTKLVEFAISRVHDLPNADANQRDSLMARIAYYQARGGDLAGAEKTLTVRSGTNPNSIHSSSSLWGDYAMELARYGLIRQAKDALAKVAKARDRDSALQALAEYYLEHGDLAAARAMAQQVTDEHPLKALLLVRIRGQALRRLIEESADHGEIDVAAIDELAALNDYMGRFEVLKQTAERLMDTGKVVEARKIIDRQPSVYSRVLALNDLQAACTRRKDSREAAAARDEIRRLLAEMGVKNEPNELDLLMRLQLELGDLAGAKSTARKLSRLPALEANALGSALLGSSQWGIDAATQAKNEPFNPTAKDSIMGRVAYAQAYLGDLKGVARTEELAVRINDYPPDNALGPAHSRDNVRLRAAEGLADKGDLEQAARMAMLVEKIPVAGESRFRWIFERCLKHGEMVFAVRIAQAVAKCSVLSKEMVDALQYELQKKFGNSIADRSLAQAVDELCSMSLRTSPALSEQIAKLWAMTGHVPIVVSPRLGMWLGKARALSAQDEIVKLDAVLQDTWHNRNRSKSEEKDIEPSKLIENIAETAMKLGNHLMDIDSLEQQSR
jgi:tetratricopeptide (TPR) repeat protein